MIGDDMCSQLLFIHAMTGCDTTSRIFGVGKRSAFHKLLKGDTILRNSANAFTVPQQPTEVIDDLGCQVIDVLFGGKSTDSLAKMRYDNFSRKVVSASSLFVTLERLPPAESATKLHSRRVCYQIMTCIGKADGMNAMD